MRGAGRAAKQAITVADRVFDGRGARISNIVQVAGMEKGGVEGRRGGKKSWKWS